MVHRGIRLPLQRNPSTANAGRDSFRTAGCTQLRKDLRHVKLGRVFRHAEARSNLFVRHAICDCAKDLQLANGKGFDRHGIGFQSFGSEPEPALFTGENQKILSRGQQRGLNCMKRGVKRQDRPNTASESCCDLIRTESNNRC